MIHLPDDSISDITGLLYHSYGLEYPVMTIKSEGNNEVYEDYALYTHATMYVLADKYAMPDLRTESLRKFSHTMEVNKGNANLRSMILEVMLLVYGATPDNDRSLRDLVSGFAAKDWAWFEQQPEIQNHAPSAFLLDVASALTKQVAKDKFIIAKTEAWRAYGNRRMYRYSQND